MVVEWWRGGMRRGDDRIVGGSDEVVTIEAGEM